MYSVTKEILQSARDKDNSEYLKMASLSTVSKHCMTKDETKNLMVNGTPECNDEKIQRDDVKVYIYNESGEMKCFKKMTPLVSALAWVVLCITVFCIVFYSVRNSRICKMLEHCTQPGE